jgi:hypothetical protein
MSFKKTVFAVALGAMFVAGPVMAADKASAEAAIAAAAAAQKEAAAVGGEWRDTAKMMKKAQEEAAAGNFGSAEKLANDARDQYELGRAQAISQKNVGNPGYLYN